VREITSHRDGKDELADRITIIADDMDPNGGMASHEYVVYIETDASDRREPVSRGDVVATIQFQRGPRDEPGSVPGITDAVLLAIVEDHMACFNAGPFSDRLNALVRTHAEAARMCLKERADLRRQRGVLGKNVK
jgi:hypothetical protein